MVCFPECSMKAVSLSATFIIIFLAGLFLRDVSGGQLPIQGPAKTISPERRPFCQHLA